MTNQVGIDIETICECSGIKRGSRTTGARYKS